METDGGVGLMHELTVLLKGLKQERVDINVRLDVSLEWSVTTDHISEKSNEIRTLF